MRIVRDESSMDLGELLGTLRSVAPDIWGSREQSLILPQKMGDLELPEYLDGMRRKIHELKELKQKNGSWLTQPRRLRFHEDEYSVQDLRWLGCC
jgi:hypothetical protein